MYNITHPANRSFFLTWFLAFTKSFASFALRLLNSLVMNYHQHDGYFVLSWSFLVLVNCSPQLYMIQSMACFKARAAAVRIREHGISTTYVFEKKVLPLPRSTVYTIAWQYRYRIPSIESRFHSKFIFQKHGKSFV